MKTNRMAIIKRLLPKAKHIGTIETQEGIFEIVQKGKVVLAGTVCNVGLLPAWDSLTIVEQWEDPIDALMDNWVEMPEIVW